MKMIRSFHYSCHTKINQLLILTDVYEAQLAKDIVMIDTDMSKV